MSCSLAIRCKCGKVEGELADVSPQAGNHAVCYCDDCQAFQHHLGMADSVLDANGGTHVFQTSPARLRFISGQAHVACLKLTPKGTLRWYASCCNTPIGNTMAAPGVAFVGLITACLDARDSDRVASALGPVKGRIMGRYAKGDISHLDVHDKFPLTVLVPFVGSLIMRRLRGDHRKSPFFDPSTAELIVAPRLLTREESAAAHAKAAS